MALIDLDYSGLEGGGLRLAAMIEVDYPNSLTNRQMLYQQISRTAIRPMTIQERSLMRAQANFQTARDNLVFKKTDSASFFIGNDHIRETQIGQRFNPGNVHAGQMLPNVIRENRLRFPGHLPGPSRKHQAEDRQQATQKQGPAPGLPSRELPRVLGQ